MNEFELRRSLAGLPRERAPARDLWPGIAARIDRSVRRTRARTWTWLGLAAAALMATLLLPGQLGEPRPAREAPGESLAAAPGSADAEAPHGALVAGVDLPDWLLDDAEVLAALRELEDASAELHRMVEDQPEAGHLVTLLHSTYRQQRWLARIGVGQARAASFEET
jgi:hypothetical protein